MPKRTRKMLTSYEKLGDASSPISSIHDDAPSQLIAHLLQKLNNIKHQILDANNPCFLQEQLRKHNSVLVHTSIAPPSEKESLWFRENCVKIIDSKRMLTILLEFVEWLSGGASADAQKAAIDQLLDFAVSRVCRALIIKFLFNFRPNFKDSLVFKPGKLIDLFSETNVNRVFMDIHMAGSAINMDLILKSLDIAAEKFGLRRTNQTLRS